MVQSVALFLAGTATLVDYSVKRFPHSVAPWAGKECLTHQGGAAPGRGEQGRSRLNVRRRDDEDHIGFGVARRTEGTTGFGIA